MYIHVFQEEDGENVKFDVTFINLKSMTKKRSSIILADEKTYLLRKVTWKSVTCEICLDSIQQKSEIGGNAS